MIKNTRRAYTMLSPSLLWLLLFMMIPIGLIVVISFSVNEGYGEIIYNFSLESYKLAVSTFYLKVIWQSIVWAGIATILCLLIGYPFAYFIANSGKWKNILLLLVIIPFWTNLLIRIYSWIILLSNKGVINNLLIHLGIISEPIEMMYTSFAVVVGLVYSFLPVMVLPLYASIEQLDKRYLEAAEDLGAGPVSTFLKVTLPLTLPGIAVGFILTFLPAVSIFIITELLTGGKLVMIGDAIRDAFLIDMNWPFGSALVMVVMLIIFLTVAICMKLMSGKGKPSLF